MNKDEKNPLDDGYVDLHCHLVAGVDDGAASEHETGKMLEIAGDDGIDTIVATPHVFSSHSRETDPLVLFKKVEALASAYSGKDSPVTVLPGAEVFFTSNLFEYLMEYKQYLTLHGASDFMYRVMMEGLIPVIAHVERNSVIQRNPRLAYEMVQMGALCQVNAASFTGYFGEVAEDTARLLLKHNLIQVIASDAHSSSDRRPEISSVIRQLQAEGFEHAVLLAAEVPRSIVRDKGIPDTGMPEDPARHKSFFDFIRKKFK